MIFNGILKIYGPFNRTRTFKVMRLIGFHSMSCSYHGHSSSIQYLKHSSIDNTALVAKPSRECLEWSDVSTFFPGLPNMI